MGLGPTEWPQGCSLGMEPEVPGRGGGCITGTVGPGGGGGGSGGVPRESPSGWGWVLPSGPKGAPWEWNLRYLDVVVGASLAPSVRGGGGVRGGS